MTKSKKKIILSLMIFAFVVLTAVAVVSIAFSLTQQTITSSNLSIEYIAEDIDGSVYATYKIGSGEEKYLVPTAISGELDSEHKDGNSLLFKAADTNNAGRLEFPESDQNIALKSNEDLIIKYTYSNTGDKHYIATMSFDYALTYENMNVEYSTDGIAYATERYALVVPSGTTEMSYWIKISIEDKTKDASLNGNFNWLLKGCDDSTEEYRSLTALEFKGNNGSYSASLSGAGGQDGKIVFPSEINGDPVTTIVSSNMSSEEKLKVKEIVIPDSVITIGERAFNAFSNLENLELPDNVENLGQNSFFYAGLISLKIGKNVSNIGYRAFGGTYKLESIIVDPENTTYYSENNCLIKNGDNDEKILELGCKTSIIPNGVTRMATSCFFSCTYLTEINIPASVTKIDEYAIFGCGRITSITVDPANEYYYSRTSDGVEYNCIIEKADNKLINACNNTIIPDGTEIISNSAFYSLNIKSINIPSSVTSIGPQAFELCQNVTTVQVAEGNEVYYVVGNCLIEKESKTLVFGCSVSVIPSDGSVITIGKWAFRGQRKLKEILIPDSVTTICQGAFNDCSALTSVTISKDVTKIDNQAFQNCGKLASVTFVDPNGWYVADSSDAASGISLSSTDLADTAIAATYLTTTYTSKAYWRKK